MFSRILVTGYSGFTGPWVLEALRRAFPQASLLGAARHEVAANGRCGTAPDRHYRLDLSDENSIESLIGSSEPDAVVHLASRRRGDLRELLAVNVLGFHRLLTHLRTVSPAARIVVVGSAAELGRADGWDAPMDEGAACRPVDLYGVTKQAQSALADQQALRGQAIVRLRLFNLLGPAMPEILLPGRCARMLHDAERATGPVDLEFGPLGTYRDYVDVRDAARAVALALAHGQLGGFYHIGSGESRSGREIVEALIQESGLEGITYRERDMPGAALVPRQTADYGRARRDLSWQPTIDWRVSLRDLWESVWQTSLSCP